MVLLSNFESYVTIHEIAKLLKLKEHTLYRLVSLNQIPFKRIGRTIRFRLSDFM